MTGWAPSAPRKPSQPWPSRTSTKGAPLIATQTGTAIRMYDSASRSVRAFESLRPGEIGVYNCGPTVYDWQHIGNLYSYLTADIARRAFEYAGYSVKQVMNITDAGHLVGDADTDSEDKIALAAKREHIDPLAVAERYTKQFFIDRAK